MAEGLKTIDMNKSMINPTIGIYSFSRPEEKTYVSSKGSKCGGLITICFALLMLSIVGLRINVMHAGSQDEITSETYRAEWVAKKKENNPIDIQLSNTTF
jgi:hypothetical protein